MASDLGGYSKDALLNQAQNIWTMLDEMALSDPAAYRAFIDKQMKEGKEYMAPPDPHMCVKTSMIKPKNMPYFINFCSWNRVPSPKSPEDAVPVTGTPTQEHKDDTGVFSYTSCAFNPKILEEYGLDTKSIFDRDTLINLAIDFIHDNQQIELSRKYEVLPREKTYMGDIKTIQKNFTQKSGDSEKFEDQLTDLEKSFGPLPMGAKDTLLHKLANMSTEDKDSSSYSNNNVQKENVFSTPDPDIKFPATASSTNKKHLIEEISPTELPAPSYTMETKVKDDIEMIVLRIDLPGVSSVGDCELDISEEDLELHVEERFHLQLKFPCSIEEENAKAKFIRKSSSLTLTLPKIVT